MFFCKTWWSTMGTENEAGRLRVCKMYQAAFDLLKLFNWKHRHIRIRWQYIDTFWFCPIETITMNTQRNWKSLTMKRNLCTGRHSCFCPICRDSPWHACTAWHGGKECISAAGWVLHQPGRWCACPRVGQRGDSAGGHAWEAADGVDALVWLAANVGAGCCGRYERHGPCGVCSWTIPCVYWFDTCVNDSTCSIHACVLEQSRMRIDLMLT